MKAGIKRYRKGRFNKAQNFTELALIIGVVGIIFIGMEVYVRRGVNGKIKDLTDAIIGTEQAAYSVDTSGLEINTSESDFKLGSNMIESTVVGGAGSIKGTETSRTISSSESLDEP